MARRAELAAGSGRHPVLDRLEEPPSVRTAKTSAPGSSRTRPPMTATSPTLNATRPTRIASGTPGSEGHSANERRFPAAPQHHASGQGDRDRPRQRDRAGPGERQRRARDHVARRPIMEEHLSPRSEIATCLWTRSIAATAVAAPSSSAACGSCDNGIRENAPDEDQTDARDEVDRPQEPRPGGSPDERRRRGEGPVPDQAPKAHPATSSATLPAECSPLPPRSPPRRPPPRRQW